MYYVRKGNGRDNEELDNVFSKESLSYTYYNTLYAAD